jgi:hypothetical protein
LKVVFHSVKTSKKSTKIEVPWFYDARQWSDYERYVGAEHIIDRPYEELIKPRRHEKFPYEIP